MVASRPGRADEPPATTDELLTAILGELTTIRRQLVQDPQDVPPSQPQAVSEPYPRRRR